MRMRSDSTTLVRAAGLEVYEAADGLVVFNPASDRVHHLNPTAAVVFELCNGSTTTSEIPTLVARLFALEAGPDAAVESVLRELVHEGVLVEANREASG